MKLPTIIPRLHRIEEWLLGLVIVLLPLAIFALADKPLCAGIYCLVDLQLMLVWTLIELVKLHRFLRRSRAYRARVQALHAAGRQREAEQALCEWGEFLDQHRDQQERS